MSVELLHYESSFHGSLSRDNSIDSAYYISPLDEAKCLDRPVAVGRPRLNKHKVKHSRKMQRNERVRLSLVEVPEEWQAYAKIKEMKRTHQHKAQKSTAERPTNTACSVFQRFEAFREALLDQNRNDIVARIRECSQVGAAYDITVSSTPLDSLIMERFLRATEGRDMELTFHGTNVENYQSIFTKGLCMPNTNGVTVRHGSAHGIGIYTSTSASYSCSFTNTTALLICAVRRGTVKSVGTTRVAFHAEDVVPIAVVSWGAVSANAITGYTTWRQQFGTQPLTTEEEVDDAMAAFAGNVFFESLERYLREKQPAVRWMKRVERRKKGKQQQVLARYGQAEKDRFVK